MNINLRSIVSIKRKSEGRKDKGICEEIKRFTEFYLLFPLLKHLLGERGRFVVKSGETRVSRNRTRLILKVLLIINKVDELEYCTKCIRLKKEKPHHKECSGTIINRHLVQPIYNNFIFLSLKYFFLA